MKGPILVTGAGGLLGRHLGDVLRARGLKPALSHHARGPLACDLSDHAAAARLITRVKPRTVFHLAGTTAAVPWGELWNAHVGATLGLMEALRLYAPGCVVVLSGSSAEYGDPGSAPVRENRDCRPLGPYGAGKLSQTLAALSYVNYGLDVRVARVFNALGPGLPERLAAGAFAHQIALIEKGRKAPVVEVGDLSSLRDFVDARDIAAALIALAQKGTAGEIYNVGSGVGTPVRAVLDTLLSLSKVPVKVVRAGDVSRSAGLRRIRADVQKIRSATGWRPRLSLKESLRDALNEWRRTTR